VDSRTNVCARGATDHRHRHQLHLERLVRLMERHVREGPTH
jgi:hypothetical protein